MSGSSPQTEPIERRVENALRQVIDPELGINVVDLGLVYGIQVEGDRVRVLLTMTTPACPLGDKITRDAEEQIRRVDGVRSAVVELVWDPPWSADRMSAKARELLGWGS